MTLSKIGSIESAEANEKRLKAAQNKGITQAEIQAEQKKRFSNVKKIALVLALVVEEDEITRKEIQSVCDITAKSAAMLAERLVRHSLLRRKTVSNGKSIKYVYVPGTHVIYNF